MNRNAKARQFQTESCLVLQDIGNLSLIKMCTMVKIAQQEMKEMTPTIPSEDERIENSGVK